MNQRLNQRGDVLMESLKARECGELRLPDELTRVCGAAWKDGRCPSQRAPTSIAVAVCQIVSREIRAFALRPDSRVGVRILARAARTSREKVSNERSAEALPFRPSRTVARGGRHRTPATIRAKHAPHFAHRADDCRPRRRGPHRRQPPRRSHRLAPAGSRRKALNVRAC